MGRRVAFRETVQTFLIVCEGEETEPQYFRAFRVPGDVKNVQVEGLGRNTVSLVEEAIKLKAKGDYDQVWVVFDIEDYCADQVNRAIHLARKNGINYVYSNQAFEIWYLLHYHYYNTSTDRKEYGRRLSGHLKSEYWKSRPGMYKELLHLQKDAIARAKKLLEQYQPHKPCDDDPCTTVYRLVEELNRFTPDSRR